MRIEQESKLDFSDVLIKPKRSEVSSRSEIVLKREYKTLNSLQKIFGVPIVASNMDTIGTFEMAKELFKNNMFCCLNKHYSVDEIVEFFNKKESSNSFYTMGISKEDFDKLYFIKTAFSNVNIGRICVDVANGYSQNFVDKVRKIREENIDAIIMAGNVATPEMTQELLISGKVDIVKIGIGPGSVCTTRIKTGVGYPQLSAIIECADAAHGVGGLICADGGCTTSGDVAKAFGGGADFVMLGGMFAGHDECNSDWVLDGNDQKVVMKFYGMSSEEANKKYNGGLKDYRSSEGKEVYITYKGSINKTVQDITGGLRSACAYVGAFRLKDLSKCTTFVKCSKTHNGGFN